MELIDNVLNFINFDCKLVKLLCKIKRTKNIKYLLDLKNKIKELQKKSLYEMNHNLMNLCHLNDVEYIPIDETDGSLQFFTEFCYVISKRLHQLGYTDDE